MVLQHMAPGHPGGFDEESRLALTKMIMQLFDLWELSTKEQLELLGLEPNARSTLTRYRHKNAAMSSNRDLIERVGHLLSIHKSLRILFPRNRDLAYRWMSARNSYFEHKTPVEVIQKYGYIGLVMIRTYLDRERSR